MTALLGYYLLILHVARLCTYVHMYSNNVHTFQQNNNSWLYYVAIHKTNAVTVATYAQACDT